MPDYEFRKWDSSSFDMHSVPYVERAYKAGLWAFASDYIRLYALHEFGGFYLDCDVLVRKSFDEFLNHDFCSSVECHPSMLVSDNPKQGYWIQAAILASTPGHPFLKAAMQYYESSDFGFEENEKISLRIAPEVLAEAAEDFGFRFQDTKQELSNRMVVYPSNVFA